MTLVALYVVVLLLCALLVLVSYVDRLYTESGKFLSREFQENIEAFEKLVEPRLLRASHRAALAFAVLDAAQSPPPSPSSSAISSFVTSTGPGLKSSRPSSGSFWSLLSATGCCRTCSSRARAAHGWCDSFRCCKALIYIMLPITVALGFGLSVAALAEPHEPEEPEHPSEAVDALIEAAEEEGILQESDRQLIQSVVEFGDKTVREVMTPRPNIFAVPSTTTIEEFTTLAA